MTLVSIAAFLGSYFSLFHEIRIDLFFAVLGFLFVFLILTNRQVFLFSFVTVLFYIWTSFAIDQQLDTRFNESNKTNVTLDLEIIELPQYKNQSISFIAKPIKLLGNNENLDFLKLKKIKLNWYRADQQLKGGQVWRMKIRLQPPHGYQNEGGFDYERWMFAEGISATGYVITSFQPKLISESSISILNARSWLSEQIKTTTQSTQYSALFQTLSIGDKSQLDPDLKQLFVDTGTAHLLVISGLHVGLLSLLFYFLGSRLWLILNIRYKTTLNQQDFSVLWALLAAFIYAALAGFSLPTLRALIMLSVVYIAMIRRHQVSLVHSLSLAVFIVLVLQPLSLLSYSFWLSFLAIVLIGIAQYLLKNCSKLTSILLLQLLFSLLFIPLYAVIFQQIIISSFFANLVLIPVMSFVVIPLNLLASFLTTFDWSLTEYLYSFLDFILNQLVNYLKWLNSILGKSIALESKQSFLMMLSSFGAIVVLVFRKGEVAKFAFLVMVIPWFYWPEKLKQAEFLVNFFDVGMGTAILVKTRHHHLLYDLGPGNKSNYQPAKWVVMPYLEAKGINTIDKVVISHSDQDHYGGIWPLLTGDLSLTKIVSGNPQTMDKILGDQFTVYNCHNFQPWSWDGVQFKFLPLMTKERDRDNNHSCVLSISSKNGRVLLAGDIEKRRELELVSQFKQDLEADILLVPHHGSRTSSTPSFLKAVGAKYAVVSSGFLNRWGFPKLDIKKRYEQLNIEWFNTALDGSITFNLNNDGIKVARFRQRENKFWY